MLRTVAVPENADEVFAVQVEVFSDVVCPWCYIGKRRLEEALSTFPHADEVTITYRSFQLDPTTPKDATGSVTEHLATKYGVSAAQAAAMQERVAGVAATVGLDFDMEHTQSANTFDAHRLLHFAAEQGKQAELKERLMQAYFTQGARVGDHAELVRLAGEVGLPTDRAAEVLASGEYADGVESDIALARGFGVSGVPFFVFDRTYGVSGAQETAVFTDVLDKAWAESHPLTVVGGGDACEGDSCAI